MMRRIVAGGLAAALTLAMAACGDDDDTTGTASDGGNGKTLTVYSSLPRQGAQEPQTSDLVRGIELALEQCDLL